LPDIPVPDQLVQIICAKVQMCPQINPLINLQCLKEKMRDFAPLPK